MELKIWNEMREENIKVTIYHSNEKCNNKNGAVS